MAPDDPAISDDEVVLRWTVHEPNRFSRDQDQGRWRISSGALIVHHDGLSVYLHSVLTELGMSPQQLLDETPGASLWSISVAEARELGFGVRRDPASDGLRSDPAHALLLPDSAWGRKATRRACSRLAKRMRHAAGELPPWSPE